MTGPDLRVMAALDGTGRLDQQALRKATRLAETTLTVSLRKLARMGLVDGDESGRFRLTAKGRRVAKESRTTR